MDCTIFLPCCPCVVPQASWRTPVDSLLLDGKYCWDVFAQSYDVQSQSPIGICYSEILHTRKAFSLEEKVTNFSTRMFKPFWPVTLAYFQSHPKQYVYLQCSEFSET